MKSPNNADFDSEFKPEQLLGGRYKVLSLIGRGGMGVVYKVEQIYLEKELALKTINKTSLTDNSVRRFQAEARAVFALNHPNVISVHDFGLLDEHTPFLAMEYVNGESLAETIKTRILNVSEAIPIFIQACKGLAHAHEHGVVHRDIKPGNIMLVTRLPPGTEGSIKILDFGIAKLTEHESGEIQSLTRTGEIFGSPLYMSPEQCGGGKIDHRSDIYSLGCVMFEALTGTTPFVGDSALSTMMMHQSAPAPSLREASLGGEFPNELEQVVKAMLAKNPDNRYQSLEKAAQDLAATLGGDGLQHNPLTQPESKLIDSGLKAVTITIRRRMLYTLIFGVVFFSAALGTTITNLLMTYTAQIPKFDSHQN
ncbi:hypothetical protein BH10CYA1_BH10CYA1_29220 [soil metagenome]